MKLLCEADERSKGVDWQGRERYLCKWCARLMPQNHDRVCEARKVTTCQLNPRANVGQRTTTQVCHRCGLLMTWGRVSRRACQGHTQPCLSNDLVAWDWDRFVSDGFVGRTAELEGDATETLS